MQDGGGCHYAVIRSPGGSAAFQFGILAADGEPEAWRRAVMINYEVDDFEGYPEHLRRSGVAIENTSEDEYGRFAHIADPEGNRIEIWQAPASGSPS